MDTGDLYRMSSLRRSSSAWRNRDDVFSRSQRGEDDEEELMWAALEKLPTYDRVRKGILTTMESPAASAAGGGLQEVDVRSLGMQERRTLLDRLVKIADKDNEKFLLKLKDRVERVGIELPTIEVRYEKLNLEADVFVGGRAVPTLLNAFLNTVEGVLSSLHILSSKKRRITVLGDASGIIKPKRMTLLLGPPGSGKTSLLLALAGKLDSDLTLSGKITYNGHEFHEFVPQRTAAYISQHDLHIGELTVRETLAFSARCQGVGTSYDLLTELLRREKEAHIKPDPDLDVFMKASAMEGQKTNVTTDYIIKLLGLEVCADTLVGDEMFRGISGGQRKRVTTGEMLVGPSRALFMDEISTGLDSSTTYSIVNSIRQFIHILGGTALISLLQPAPETYDLFDDIILLSDGVVVYHGPRENVVEFFESIGFKCPERKGVADFLQEVTSRKDQGQYWSRHAEPYRFVPVKEIAKAFKTSHVGKNLYGDLAIPFNKEKSHPAALATTKYGVDKKELLKACTERELLLMQRNSFVYIFKAVQLLIMNIISMTVFLRTKMHRNSVTDGSIYMGSLFYSLMIVMFNGMIEITMVIGKLPVYYKHRDMFLYPAWAYALPTWIPKIPITFMEVAVWVFMNYYVIGLDPNVGRMLKQYMLFVVVNQMASALFRLIAATGRNMIVANTFGSFVLLAIMSLGGFIISRKDVKKWWIWGYWISPVMFAQNAVAVNEFLGHSWSHIPAGSNQTLGVQILKSRGIFPEAKWYWIGLAASFAFIFLFQGLYTAALAFLPPSGKAQAVISEDTINLRKSNLTGEIGPVEMTSKVKGRRQHASPEANSRHKRNNSSQLDVQHDGDRTNAKKGMVLPFEPHSITFDDVQYSVDMPQGMSSQGFVENKLVLLKGVSGAFRPGVLTALMGVSGAGKTTLMDVLAGRKTGGYIEGEIRISGYPKKQETFARISGYCEQEDIHSPHVTVYESLLYSAWLRLSADIDSATRKMFVEEVMELVELTSIQEALVGLPGVNGLSTEQRKRLTIAVELVANPSIIFMDEPTSGLDARAAAIVMRTVRNTVDTGRTVVCTIHQPSIDIFEAFDELFLLKRGGEEIYVGPLGRNSCHLIKYLECIEGVAKIKDGYNPATWMLEVTSGAQEEILGMDFAEIYKKSELYSRNKALIKELSIPAPGSKDLYFVSQYSQPFLTQCIACLWKQKHSYWRNVHYTAVRFFFTLFVALMFGTIFWDIGSKRRTMQDLFNAMGSMYAAVLFLGVQNSSSVQPVVAIERSVFYRERAAGMYSALPYAFGQAAIEIPYIFMQAASYGIIVYAMIGFEWTAAKFFWYLFLMYFTLLYFTFFGMMSVGITPNHHIASIISIALIMVWNIFTGFIIPRTRIPLWWRWNFWACPIAWTLYGLVASQFGDIEDSFDDGTVVKEFVRDYFGYKHDFLGVVAVVVVGLAVTFALLFAWSVRTFNFQRR